MRLLRSVYDGRGFLATVTYDSCQPVRLEVPSSQTNKKCISFEQNNWQRAIALLGAVLCLGSALHAEEKCSVEIKLLLSSPTLQSAITSLQFGKETASRVYFFDTDQLDLLKQGIIIRVRQGANNDLTLKVRVPEGNQQVDTSQFRQDFPCEINRTGAGEDTDYAVKRKYKTLHVPEKGVDIVRLLSPPQKKLLQKAGVSIDWARVKKIANIKTTSWETAAQSPFRKLALELWESPAGNIVEISAKVGPDEEPFKYAQLQQLLNRKNLPLSASQGSKTSTALEALTQPTSSIK
jgi:hypothetical protein